MIFVFNEGWSSTSQPVADLLTAVRDVGLEYRFDGAVLWTRDISSGDSFRFPPLPCPYNQIHVDAKTGGAWYSLEHILAGPDVVIGIRQKAASLNIRKQQGLIAVSINHGRRKLPSEEQLSSLEPLDWNPYVANFAIKSVGQIAETLGVLEELRFLDPKKAVQEFSVQLDSIENVDDAIERLPEGEVSLYGRSSYSEDDLQEVLDAPVCGGRLVTAHATLGLGSAGGSIGSRSDAEGLRTIFSAKGKRFISRLKKELGVDIVESWH